MMGHGFNVACAFGAAFTLAVLASNAPAAAEPNGRPPPIKIGTPSPSPSPTPAPIKIGKPAPKPEGFSGNDPNTTKQIYDAVLKVPLKPEFHEWLVGQPTKLLNPVATHICLLTGVGGNFAGGGERVVVGIDKGAAGGERWYISGSSGQAELRATATCVRKDLFAPYVPGMTPSYGIGSYKLPNHMNGACASHIASDGWRFNNYAHFISEVAGKWRGGGEKLGVVQTAQGLGAIQVNGCSGFVDGALTAIGSNSFTAKYWTASGRTNTVAAATFSFTNISGGGFTTAGDDLVLAPVDEAICGIVGIAGKFQGYGEAVEIVVRAVNGKLHWVLQTKNQAAQGHVHGAARCFARDQR